MAASQHGLMTVAEFLPFLDGRGPVYHELRHGVLFAVTRPRFRHAKIQRQIEHLLERHIAEPGMVFMVFVEFAFMPIGEHDLRVADVAFVTEARCRAVADEDQLRGASDLVVEVLSPSNTPAEMLDRQRICLENGAREFWTVDPDRKEVQVHTPDGRATRYTAHDGIPLTTFSGSPLPTASIFRV